MRSHARVPGKKRRDTADDCVELKSLGRLFGSVIMAMRCAGLYVLFPRARDGIRYNDPATRDWGGLLKFGRSFQERITGV
jgi:hypothetical protein